LTSCEGEKAGGILPSGIMGRGADSLLGDEMTEAAGMTLAFLARRKISRNDRAYRPAGTTLSAYFEFHIFGSLPSESMLASSSTSFAVFLRLSSLGNSRAIRIRNDAANAAQTSKLSVTCWNHVRWTRSNVSGLRV
jgi:hypothetical protein